MFSKDFGRSWRLSAAVYAMCAVVLLAFAASNLFVLNRSGTAADEAQSRAQTKLVRNELMRQIDRFAADQSQISNWDKTIIALEGELDEDFVTEEIVEWLWADFRIATTVVLSPKGKVRAASERGHWVNNEFGELLLAENKDLVEETTRKYLESRVKTPEGYKLLASPLNPENPIFAAEFRSFRGQIGAVLAQAIVPDSEARLGEGRPHVLLSFKPFDAPILKTIAAQLDLPGFRLTMDGPPSGGEKFLTMTSRDPARALTAIWEPAVPSKVIVENTRHSLIAILIFVFVGLSMIAWRHANALWELQRSEMQNRFLALHDAMTGLPNRMHFDRELERIIERRQQARCAILCLDLDRFKAVNDTYGHQAGDIVIKTVADRLGKSVDGLGMAARVGGDEFIVLLRNKLDRDHVSWLCDQIIESVCQEIEFDGGSAHVGASIGVAWWPDDALTAKSIIRSADEALYNAKEKGRGCTQMACDLKRKKEDKLAA